jgi:hypothetical protein
MAHPLGIAGLALSMVGAGLLLWFPPVVPAVFTKEGSQFLSWVNNPTPEGLRRYARQKWGSRLAIGTLVLGFLLQLIDLLRS